MRTHQLRIASLVLAMSLVLVASNPTEVTQRDWVRWLERDAGTPPAAARCVAKRSFETLPPEVLEAAPRIGFSALPGGWRERIAASYTACVVLHG